MARLATMKAGPNWYGRKIWSGKPAGLRWRCLVAAMFTCQQCGWMAKASETDHLHADHKIPHRGDWDKFRDFDNLRCLCETCHNAAKQSEEKLGYSKEIGQDGWPLDPAHPRSAPKYNSA